MPEDLSTPSIKMILLRYDCSCRNILNLGLPQSGMEKLDR